MPTRSRIQVPRGKTCPAAWSTHQRVAEVSDSEEPNKAPCSTKNVQIARSQRSDQPITSKSTLPRSRQPLDPSTQANRKLAASILQPAQKPVQKRSEEPDRTAAQTFFARGKHRIEKLAPSPQDDQPNVAPSQNTQNLPQPAADKSSEPHQWYSSQAHLVEREPGKPTTYNGQPGRWHCFTNAPYSSLKEWVFMPDKPAIQKKKRTRHKKARTKDTVTFLSLPGELRNEIYRHLVPERRMLIVRNKPNKAMARSKQVWSEQHIEHTRPKPRLGHMLDSAQIEKGLGITKNLLLACKQIRNDVELYLYSRTTFCFSSLKVLNRFLDTASKPGLRAIRKVELLDQGYASPELTDHQQYQDKYYAKWSETCNRIGNEVTGLDHIKLEAHLRDWPCDMTSKLKNTSWRKACVQMAPRRVAKVEVKLFHPMIHRNAMVLRELARDVENDMMTQQGIDERDRLETLEVLKQRDLKVAAKAARLKAKLKATPELTISMNDVEHQKPTPVKVCKTGLEGYARVNTVDMCSGEAYQFKDHYGSEKHKHSCMT